LRGGGGNFGIVTGFRFRLHPVPPLMLSGLLIYPAPMARDVMRFYRDFIADAPDEVGGAAAFLTAPPADFVPEPARGQPVLGIVVLYVGDVAEGERAFAPLRAFGPPAADLVQPMPYLAVQGLLEPGNPHGMRNYWSADYFTELPDEAIDVLVGHAAKPTSPLTQIVVAPGRGAITRVPDDAMAFGQRHAGWNIHYLSMWPEAADDSSNIAFTRGIAKAMKPWTTGQVYLNFIGDEGGDRVRAAFGPEKYTRLQALKRTWDPENVFRHNQNITPA
jgi:FAD/FMN-containing dehydrogenase